MQKWYYFDDIKKQTMQGAEDDKKKQMVEANLVVRTEDKRKAYFSKA